MDGGCVSIYSFLDHFNFNFFPSFGQFFVTTLLVVNMVVFSIPVTLMTGEFVLVCICVLSP
jgi:hypothetical protein